MTETARIYGGSLYDLAAEENLTSEMLGQMEQIRTLVRENPEYERLLSEPSIPQTERTGMIEAALERLESIGNGSYYVYGTNFTASSRLEINKELQETQYISPTQLLVQNVELADGDQVSVATQSNSSTKKVLSRTDYLTYNEDNGELMSQESYQAKKSAKAMIERLKEQHEKAQADEQADDGQTQEETTTEETTPELSLTPAPASTPES